MACVITFNNKKYNYEEFASMLVAGELDKMISDGLIDKSKLSGDMSVLSKGEEQTMPESEDRGVSFSKRTEVPSALKDVESTTQALKNIDNLKVYRTTDKTSGSAGIEGIYIDAKFGKNGGIQWEIPASQIEEGNKDNPDYVIVQGISNKTESQQKGEGSQAIASLFNRYPSLEEIAYDDQAESGFWQKIGGGPDILKRADFFKYYNKKSQSISEAYHKAKEDNSNPELVNAVEDLLGGPGKGVSFSKGPINWEVSEEGKGDPSISVRNPVVQESANKLKEGKITNEEYRATVSANTPIMPITRFFEPATDEQIKRAFEVATKKDSEAKLINAEVKNGEIVATRLDIPSYKYNNTWVVSVHDGSTNYGPIKSYRSVARLKNVTFSTSPTAALNIAGGKAKQTIARMVGEWVEFEGATSKEKNEAAKKYVESIVNDPRWVQIGMNPFRHSHFYDRSSEIGRPIKSTSEIVQIGGLVYAKDVEYGDWKDEDYQVKGLLDAAGKAVSFSRSTTGSTANPLRGTLDRLSGNLDEKVREEIEANPDAYIDPLKINEAKAKFGLMSDQDLMDYMSNTGISILSRDPASNIGLMAKIEAIKRAQNAPDKKFEGVDLSTLLVDAAQLGSVGGRILRMMRELGTINPSTYADLVIKMIEGTGAVLSEDNKASIKLLSKDVVDAGSATLLANSEFEKNPSRANQIALEEARKLENETMDALTKYIEPKMPVSLSKSFISNMQGNLLQIESLGVNLTSTTVGGLFLFLPKALAKTGISLVRYGVGKAFKTSGNNIAELGYLTALNYYIRAYSPAFSKAWNIMKNGTNSEINVARGEVRSSLKPTTLLNVLFNSEEYARRVKGSEDFEYRMFNGKYEVFSQNAPNKVLHTFNTEAAAKKMAFELSNPLDWTNTNKYIIKTITGLAPEAMFRIMSATDTLIREPNTAYINAMFGTRLGLKGEDLASFVFEPSKEYKEHLKYQAAKSVFQEDRKATTIVTNAIKELENMSNSNMLASGLNVMVRTSMPYVKTPANIVAQYIDYAFPFWPMYKAITTFAKANTEKSEAKKKILIDTAEESMSVALTGFGMWAAFSMLALGGLMTAGYDHYDDDEKDLMARIGIPFSSVNISAVKRLMDGGSMENQPNDEYVALKYFGLFGMVGQMHSNRIQKERAEYMKNSKVFNGSNEETMTAKFFEMFSVFDVMGTAFDQSFAAGINTIFGVMRDPESKGTYAVRGYAQSLVAGFGVPATVSKYFEAEYIPNLTDKNSAVKTFTNVFMYRMAGITDGVPAKIDVFGRKLAPYAPEGKDPKIYNTFYPFKVKKSTGDPIDFMLYETMVKSKNPAVIPSKYKQQDIMKVLPDLEVSGFRPTPADVEALNIDRGQRRLQKLTEMMNGEYFAYVDNGELVEVETFDKLPVNSRVEYIKAAYKDADAEHISEFRNDYVRKIAQGLGAKFIEQEEQEETEE